MGMPACRITDLTAHGGTIVLGFPQVLIGEMPASRITDLHVCPMVTVLVPHVGGPFVMGSATVLVGMMPQSRVTDQLVCVGPPDIAVLGEMTVLVGMAGAGGAAGASEGAAAAGVPVASAPAAGVAANAKAPRAQAQADGTVKTSAAQALPPVTLKQAGWPDLPSEHTASFQSVQPATLLPGTTLYAASDADSAGGNAYWGTAPPAAPATQWNSATHVQVATVPPGDGVKAWAGFAASDLAQGDQAASDQVVGAAAALQVWAPPGAMADVPTQRFRMPAAAGGADL